MAQSVEHDQFAVAASTSEVKLYKIVQPGQG